MKYAVVINSDRVHISLDGAPVTVYEKIES